LSVVHPLPGEGVDLRAEVAAHQRSRVEQAMTRAGGDLGEAAKLLRVTPLELARLVPGAAPAAASGSPAASTKPAAPSRPSRSSLGPRPSLTTTLTRAERDALIPRIEGGIERISAAVIRRLAAEGMSEQRIASRLGCNPHVIEKVLRMQAENANAIGEPRKCGHLPARPQWRGV
jgi:hypothetical protein